MATTIAPFQDASGWERALYAFLAEKERRSGSHRTVQGYSRMLQHFFGTLGKPPDQVTSQEVFAWAYGKGLSGKEPSPVAIGGRVPTAQRGAGRGSEGEGGTLSAQAQGPATPSAKARKSGMVRAGRARRARPCRLQSEAGGHSERGASWLAPTKSQSSAAASRAGPSWDGERGATTTLTLPGTRTHNVTHPLRHGAHMGYWKP